jgi:hypothetical protein
MNDWNIRIIYPPDSLFETLAPFPPTYGYRMIGTQRRLILRDYPYTLYSRTPEGVIKWLGFVYAFLYWDKEGKQVIRLERLTSFSEEKEEQEKIYSRLLAECMQLAKIMRAEYLEVEVYRRIGGEISFPSTMSHFNTYNPPEICTFFSEAGFQPKTTTRVYTLSPQQREKRKQPKHPEYTIKPYTHSLRERRSYWSLWSENPYSVETFPQNEAGWELDYGMKIARDPRFVLFEWKNDEIIGCAHWFPNFYQISPKSRRAKNSEWLIVHSDKVESGKIFKVMINPEFDSKDLRMTLCQYAMKIMQNEFKLKKIHIGNIRSDDETMLEVIKELGGQELHVIDIMARTLYTDN